MARGNECNTINKSTHEVELPKAFKGPVSSSKAFQPAKKADKKDYGAWGSIYKNKKNFLDMHFC